MIKALIIDDNQADADYLKSFMNKLKPDFHFQIQHEPDVRRALERLGKEEFGLVFVDYQMPTMSGLEIVSKIRERDRVLPVIMLTGMGNESVAVEAMKRGAHDYLRKDQLSETSLACTITAALERKQLEDELASRRRSIEQDLRMARELQQAFLPQSFPHFAPQQPPDATGLRFYHHYTPTLSVGGDFFDVVPIADHAAGVFVSDVAGHGMQAALVTAVLRTLIEELKDEAAEPEDFLAHVNRGLHRILRQTTSPVFASAFYLKMDLDAQQVSFANAGHPPQLHLRRHEGSVTRLHVPSKTGPVLGMMEDAVFPTHTTRLDAEDVFLLFTDGLVEVPNETGEPFGLPRLEAAAKKVINAKPSEMVEQLVKAASEFSGAEMFPDDVCLVAVEAASLMKR